jgi:hypothetical protein
MDAKTIALFVTSVGLGSVATILLGGETGILNVNAQQKKSESIVTAERVDLIDKSGKARATFGLDGGGFPELTLRASEGKEQISLSISSGGVASLKLQDSRGKNGVGITISPKGVPRIELTDGNSQRFVDIGTNERGAFGLYFLDRNRVERASVMLDPDEDPSINLIDPKGRTRIVVSAKNESNFIWVLDKDSKILWKTP